MSKKYLSLLLFISVVVSQATAQIVPYKRGPVSKPGGAGVYPKLKNIKPVEGREPGMYAIRFKLQGVKPGDTVYLADYHLDNKYWRDTTVVDKKLNAVFTGTQKLQRGFYLFIYPERKGMFDIIVDDDQDFTISVDTAYYSGEYYKKMKVEGSEQNQAYVNYLLGKETIVQNIYKTDNLMKTDTVKSHLAGYRKQLQEYYRTKANYDSVYIAKYPTHILSHFIYSMEEIEIPEAIQKSKDSNAGYYYYKQHYFDNIDLGDDAMVRLPVNTIKSRLDNFFDKVIPPDADTCILYSRRILQRVSNTLEVEHYVTWYLVNRFESSNIMGMDKAFVVIAGETYCKGKAWWQDSGTVARMCDNVQKRWWTLIGNPAPPIELQDNNENWVNTANIKAPYTILIFWDPTCGHCREVMPKLAKIYAENKAKGWKVVALAPSDKRKEWHEYLKEHPEMSEFIHLMRGEVKSQEMADNLLKYYVIASPTIFIISEDKKIEANRIDVDKIPEFIEHLDKLKAAKAQQKTN